MSSASESSQEAKFVPGTTDIRPRSQTSRQARPVSERNGNITAAISTVTGVLRELQQQAEFAQPVLRQAASEIAVHASVTSRRLRDEAVTVWMPRCRTLAVRCRERVATIGRQRLVQCSVICCGLVVLCLVANWLRSDSTSPVALTESVPTGDSVIIETVGEQSSGAHDHESPVTLEVLAETVSSELTDTLAFDNTKLPVVTEQQANGSAQLDAARRQALAELQVAASEYDFAVAMWNAEVAACDQPSHAQYSSHQMGQFAAMGVPMQTHPQRQPNLALYNAAVQAEQRFLNAQQAARQLGVL